MNAFPTFEWSIEVQTSEGNAQGGISPLGASVPSASRSGRRWNQASARLARWPWRTSRKAVLMSTVLPCPLLGVPRTPAFVIARSTLISRPLKSTSGHCTASASPIRRPVRDIVKNSG